MMSFNKNCQMDRNLDQITRSYKPHKIKLPMGVNKPSNFCCISSIIFLIIFGLIQVPGASGASNTVFELYWNIPTFMCKQYGILFDDVSSYGIQQNQKDQFRGDIIAILYDPGVFPALLKDGNGRTVRRNGGVPQEGNLTHHLEMFRKDVDEQIKDVNFSGVAVIDFESWRPVFRQNWGTLDPYRELSKEIERAKHPFWDKNRVSNEAVRRFEKSGRLFMEDTLRLAHTLRPKAAWGYYAYPYCYNSAPNVQTVRCDPKVYEENNGLSWMFNLQDVILPSVYLGTDLNERERMELITKRVNEGIRMSKRFSKSTKKQVLPYFWYRYRDKSDQYLTSEDLFNGFKTIKNLGGDGIILWGSSKDLNTKLECQQFKDYLANTFGPIAWKFKVGRSQNVSDFDSFDEIVTTSFVPESSTSRNVYKESEEAESSSTKTYSITENV